MEEAEHSKTEEATSYKLEQARNKGVVARGLDFGVLLAVAAVVGYFSAFGDTLAKNIARACQRAFIQAPNRKGQHSIRINDQWRVCFIWAGGGAKNVEIVDYH